MPLDVIAQRLCNKDYLLSHASRFANQVSSWEPERRRLRLSTKQREDVLRLGVGDGQNTIARLNENLRPRQFRRFLGKVRIADDGF